MSKHIFSFKIELFLIFFYFFPSEREQKQIIFHQSRVCKTKWEKKNHFVIQNCWTQLLFISSNHNILIWLILIICWLTCHWTSKLTSKKRLLHSRTLCFHSMRFFFLLVIISYFPSSSLSLFFFLHVRWNWFYRATIGRMCWSRRIILISCLNGQFIFEWIKNQISIQSFSLNPIWIPNEWNNASGPRLISVF